jgi:DeoR/GlpR family transcriptional regulator of sugar metabolism
MATVKQNMTYPDLINREQLIANYIETSGEVSVNDIVNRFDISPSTVRRILTHLAEVGVVERTHGGAAWAESSESEAPVFSRARMRALEKDRISTFAASLVSKGETIILLAGTTINVLASKLQGKEGIKVITNSLPILSELEACSGIEIIFLGGVLNRKEQSVGGYLMGLYGKELQADKIFFGVKGITPDYRLTLDDVNERDNYKIFMNLARESIVLADGSKFNQSGIIALCSLMETDALITDSSAPEAIVSDIAGRGFRIVVADGAEAGKNN